MPDSTAVTVPEAPGEVQEWSAADWGDFALPEGIAPILPEIRIVQKATPSMGPESGKHGGDFWLSDSGTFEPELTGTIILVSASKVLFDEDIPNQPVCSSLDGRVPRPGGSVWEKGTIRLKGMKEGEHAEVPMTRAPAACATCPFNIWIDRRPPPCRDSYLALFEHRDSGNLYRLRFNGTSIGPFRNWLGHLAGSSARRGGGGKTRPPASQVIRLYTTMGESKDLNTTWYEARIDTVGDTPAEDAQSYRELIQQIRPSFQRTLEETASDLAVDYGASEDSAPVDDGWGSGSGAVEHAAASAPPPKEPAQASLGGAVDPDDIPFE